MSSLLMGINSLSVKTLTLICSSKLVYFGGGVLRLCCYSNPRACTQKKRLAQRPEIGSLPVLHTCDCPGIVSPERSVQLITSSSYLSNNTPPPPSTVHALSLKARVPVGRTSSCSHLVMGKLGHTNNISAQNISPRSVEKRWPSYGEAATIFTIRGLVALLLLLVSVLVSESGRGAPTRRDGLCENGAVCRFEPDRVVFGIGNSLVLFGRKQRYAELVHIQRRAAPAQQLVVNGYTVATGKCLLSHGELVPTLPNTPIVLPPPHSCPCPIPSTHSSLDMQEGYYSLIK